jgi:cob(I)alamin adenosyltransferase
MKTKIYTKSGDLGETSLFGGPRVSKAHSSIEAYGNVDELNAVLGLARATLNAESVKNKNLESLSEKLFHIQNELFTVGSHLACADEKLRDHLPPLDALKVEQLESDIDKMNDKMPELREFILPGGHLLASQLHLARTVCRRAERSVVSSTEKPLSESLALVVTYLNRLSDYLFVVARYANHLTDTPEIKWKKP